MARYGNGVRFSECRTQITQISNDLGEDSEESTLLLLIDLNSTVIRKDCQPMVRINSAGQEGGGQGKLIGRKSKIGRCVPAKISRNR